MPNVTSVSGLSLDQRIAGADDRLEPVDRLDDVVGREDADHRLRVAPGEHRRAEADGVERVAPARLAEELLRAKPGQRPCGWPRRAIAPAQTKHRSGGSSPSSRSTAISSRLRPPINGNQLFGQRGAAHGPQPRARTAGDNHGISHGKSRLVVHNDG